jgi:hypothetical protein
MALVASADSCDDQALAKGLRNTEQALQSATRALPAAVTALRKCHSVVAPKHKSFTDLRSKVTVAALVFKSVHLEVTAWLVEMVKEMLNRYNLATYQQFQDELEDFTSTAQECAKAATTVVTLYEAMGADLRMLGNQAMKVGYELGQEARVKAEEAMQIRRVRSQNQHSKQCHD